MYKRQLENSARLNLGLKQKFEKLEALLSLLDRRGDLADFQKSSSTRPVKDFDFSAAPMQEALVLIKGINRELYERSFYNVPFIISDPNIQNFILKILDYFKLSGRVYRLYAYHAHQNSAYLKTYSFEKLSFLNLKVSKNYALEVLSKVAFKAKTLDENTVSIEFSKGTLQVFEYEALAEPVSEDEYVNLLKFLGLRESLINSWAINKISRVKENINPEQNMCGNYLSIGEQSDGSSMTY